MIKSYRDKATKKVANGQCVKSFPADILKRAKMRIDRIDAAVELEDLRVPPSHNLEPLHGDRVGQHSIRVNKKWRVCFEWNNGNVLNVEITDYH